jgi:hypothetical protein
MMAVGRLVSAEPIALSPIVARETVGVKQQSQREL